MEAATTGSVPDEPALITAAQRDRAAFAPLYEGHVHRIYQYSLCRTGSAMEAEEVTAQTFLRALEYIDRYRWTGAPFVVWLYRIADSVIHKRRRRPAPGQLPPDLAAPPIPGLEEAESRYDLLREFQRLTANAHAGPAAVVLPFPGASDRRPLRWLARVAVAALIITAGGLGVGHLMPSKNHNVGLDLTGPLFFGTSAVAADREVPPALSQQKHDMRFRLETTLPTLPGYASVSTLTFPKGTKGGYWNYVDAAADPNKVKLAQSPSDVAAVEKNATDWLKKHGHYPAGPIRVVSWLGKPDRPHVTAVRIEPAPGSDFYSMNDFPMIFVAMNGSKVFTAYGAWPDRAGGAEQVKLKTAGEAWADLQAGNGSWLGIEAGEAGVEFPQNPVLSVRQATLERAMVWSQVGRWYMIPVVVFHTDVTDIHGNVRTLTALVSALHPE